MYLKRNTDSAIMETIDSYEGKPNNSPVPFAEFWQPGRIVSLWEMITQIILVQVAHAYEMAGVIERTLEQALDDPSKEDQRAQIPERVVKIRNELGTLSSFAIETALATLSNVSKDSSNDGRRLTLKAAREVHTLVRYKLLESACFVLPDHATMFFEERIVHESIRTHLPKCIYDLEEAGKCLALARNTASVYHSMCALEPLLNWLALETARLGSVYAPEQTLSKTWGEILSKLEKEVKTLDTAHKDPAKKAELRRLGDLCAHMRSVKTAWRDDTMHAKGQFTDEIASNILIQCRAMIQYVADQISGRP